MAEKGQAVFLALLDIVLSELFLKICKYEVKLIWAMKQKIIKAWPNPLANGHTHIIKTTPITTPIKPHPSICARVV